MRAIPPRLGYPERTNGSQPHPYGLVSLALVRAATDADGRHYPPYLVSRWSFSAEDRAAIAAGEDLYLVHEGEVFQRLQAHVGWSYDRGPWRHA